MILMHFPLFDKKNLPYPAMAIRPVTPAIARKREHMRMKQQNLGVIFPMGLMSASVSRIMPAERPMTAAVTQSKNKYFNMVPLKKRGRVIHGPATKSHVCLTGHRPC